MVDAQILARRPIDQQIAEVKRELAIRDSVFPAFVARARMTQAEADEHIARLQAVLATLRVVEAHAGAIRRIIVEAREVLPHR